MAEKCKIKCRAWPGVFSHEMVIRLLIVDQSGKDVEAQTLAYADSVTVRGDLKEKGGAAAELEAYRLKESTGFVSVVLPQPTFQNGPSVIIRKTSLV